MLLLNSSRVMLEEKNVKVEFKAENSIFVFADTFYIEQVVTNYLTNAIKHVKDINERKRICVENILDKKNNKVRINVFNTGETISEENKNRIWNRFYKIDESRNRNDGGTGIGLSLVKAIMNNYNNKFGVENKKDGVQFYFELDLDK